MECHTVMAALPFDRAAVSVRFAISTLGKQRLYKKVMLLTDEYIDQKLNIGSVISHSNGDILLTLVTQQELRFRRSKHSQSSPLSTFAFQIGQEWLLFDLSGVKDRYASSFKATIGLAYIRSIHKQA